LKSAVAEASTPPESPAKAGTAAKRHGSRAALLVARNNGFAGVRST
jgi:hypothetical protein